MGNKILLKMFLAVFVVFAGILSFSPQAFARGMSGHREIEVRRHHDRYHYRDGRFYRLGWFGIEISVASPPLGVIVDTIPVGHRVIVIDGAAYYYYENVYYRPCRSGYMVVSAPCSNSFGSQSAVVTSQPVHTAETVTINVPGSGGGYTSVTLFKTENGYIGPQGEFYPEHPTVAQLKALYGK